MKTKVKGLELDARPSGTWSVCASGYQWSEVGEPVPGLLGRQTVFDGLGSSIGHTQHGTAGPWMIENPPSGPVSAPRLRYDPMSISKKRRHVFLRFLEIAALVGSIEEFKSAALNFAADFGLLGNEQTVINVPGPEGQINGESLAHWLTEAYKLKYLTDLYDALLRRDSAYLRAHVNKGFIPSLVPVSPPPPGVGVEWMQDPGMAFRAVWGHTDRMTNEECAGALLQAHINHVLETEAVVWTSLVRHAPFHVVPVTLLGAIYLLLASQLSGKAVDRISHTCECGCGQPIPPGRTQYASSQCAQRQKQRDYRKRKEEKHGSP